MDLPQLVEIIQLIFTEINYAMDKSGQKESGIHNLLWFYISFIPKKLLDFSLTFAKGIQKTLFQIVY